MAGQKGPSTSVRPLTTPERESGSRVVRARELAARLYGRRLVPESVDLTLLEHVEGVLTVLQEFSPDEDAVIACLLQHALEVGLPQSALEAQFGARVKEIVSRLRLLSHLNTDDWRRSVDDVKTMLISVSDDVRVLLLKLCARCFILEHLERMEQATHTRFSREALRLFAPLAARFGIYALKYRLEDGAFSVAYPTDAEHIRLQLKQHYEEHGAFLPAVVGDLQTFLLREGVAAVVHAREKHPYSIFQKMKRKSVTGIDKIHDLVALRVIVGAEADCYQALGLLHRLATPIAHRFKDYIAFPKPNGYQSLHTCVLGLPGAPANMMIEVQIRTEGMHREAEYGVASHWMYKEGEASSRAGRSLPLGDFLKKRQTGLGSDPKAEQARDAMLVDHIYLLTPRGDIIELPKGATPLDFAFALHSDIGLKFRAARVNGSIVRLSHKLENGDVVEVLTHKNPRPSLQWIEQLGSSSAKAKLKAYFFAHNRPQFIDRGREALNEELRSRRLPALDNELTALKTFDGKLLSMRERENLLVKVGMAAVRTSSILRHLALPTIPLKRTQSKHRAAEPRQRRLLGIEEAAIDMPFRFAKCCGIDKSTPHSVPIVGFITRSGEISVHREGCGMIRGGNPERRVKVKWL